MTPGNGAGVLAERLDRLFRTVTKPGGGEFSLREVADAIGEQQGESISHAYIGQLRSGTKDNPNLRHLRALSGFFGVPVEYLTGDLLVGPVDIELDLIGALSDLRRRRAALEATVIPEVQRSVEAVNDLLTRVQGLAAAADQRAGHVHIGPSSGG